MPPKVTVLLPCEFPKVFPVMVTAVPAPPTVGDRLVIVGATLKGAELAMPPTVAAIRTGPGCRPSGTAPVMLVLLQLVGVTTMPPKLNVLEP
jgi:hypothetical protein